MKSHVNVLEKQKWRPKRLISKATLEIKHLGFTLIKEGKRKNKQPKKSQSFNPQKVYVAWVLLCQNFV